MVTASDRGEGLLPEPEGEPFKFETVFGLESRNTVLFSAHADPHA